MSLRHHLVSVVAIFLALAVGIVLGGGPLSEGGTAVAPALADPTEQPAAPASDGYADELATAIAAQAYDGGLEERSVAVVILPGADGGTVDQLIGQVDAASGTVTATYYAQEQLVAPGEKSLVDALGSQLEQQVEGIEVDDDATTYDRIGQLLGSAVATTEPEGNETDQDTVTVVDSLGGAGLVEAPTAAQRRAPLVLVVLGSDLGTESDLITEGIVGGLADTAVGVVVAGTTASADEGGNLTRLRGSPVAASLTTTDGVDGPAGQATAVFALIRSLSMVGGAFGATGADGAVPLG